jgi:hypothetical protein
MNRNPTGSSGRSGSLIVERPGELVTVPEIAERIGLSAGRVHELARDGELPAALGRIGGIQVWEWAVVEAKLKATRGLAPRPGGSTTWAVFDHDTAYFGRPEQAFMVNFRVADLDAMLSQLRSAGVEVIDALEESEYRRFGWAVDPEGTRFEI